MKKIVEKKEEGGSIPFRSISYPAVYSDKPPAQNQSTIGEHVLRNLQALHLSHESFMKQE